MNQKYLTINDAINEINKLSNSLELQLRNKELNYNKTQPGATAFKDIVVSKTNTIFDRFIHYAIKDYEYDETIFALQESILSYERYIVKEMERLINIDPKKVKIYLAREDMNYYREFGYKRPWHEIAEIMNYSEKQIRRIYNEVANGKL